MRGQHKRIFCVIILLIIGCSIINSAVIDNFEDGDNGNWWGGYWYTYDDSSENGDSVIIPSPNEEFIPKEVTDVPNNNYAANINGYLGGAIEYPYVGLGVTLGTTTADVSLYSGIKFKAKGSGRYYFKIVDPESGNRNYKSYLYVFYVADEWQDIIIHFDTTTLAYGWGSYNDKVDPHSSEWRDKPDLSYVLSQVESFQWVTVDIISGTIVDLWIDDIELLGGGSNLPSKISSSQYDSLIDDFEDGDSINKLQGSWYTFDDSSNGGNTQVFPTPNTDFTPSQPGADNSSYAGKFSWRIENPTYVDPFGGLGTNLAPEGLFVSGANTHGIRFKYKSDAHHILKIIVKIENEEYPYQVGLPPSSSWKEVIFGWDEFVLPAWFIQEKGFAGTDTMYNFCLSNKKNRIVSIQFQSAARYKNGGAGAFEVDDLFSVGGAFVVQSTQTFMLVVNIVGNGSVIKEPDKSVYEYGEEVKLTARPNDDAVFLGWIEDGVTISTDSVIYLPIIKDVYITAKFSGEQATSYSLIVDVSPKEGGSVVISPVKDSYYYEKVTIRAIPAVEYEFVNWTDENGNILGNSIELEIFMTSDKKITANFRKKVSSLGKVHISDNPFSPGQEVKFMNLAQGDEVKIYNILGKEIITIKENNGVASWNGKDKDGNFLSSGVYIYKTTKSKAKGKIIIQR